jgi:hypothetical protein
MEVLDCQSGHLATGNSQSDNSDMSQTDEHKAAEQQNSVDMVRQVQGVRQEVKVPCVADTGKSVMLHSKVFPYSLVSSAGVIMSLNSTTDTILFMAFSYLRFSSYISSAP